MKEVALVRAIYFPKELTPFENGAKNKNEWVTIPESVFIRLKYEKTVMYGESLCFSRRLFNPHSLKEIISQNNWYLVKLSLKRMFLKTKWLSIGQFD